MLIAVNYHYVRPSFNGQFPGIHGVTPGDLEAQLRLLGTAGEFVSGEQVRDAIRGDVPLAENAIIVTFDDGLREQFEYALPVLERLGIPAIFFVNTAPIEHRTVVSVHKIHLLRSRIPPDEFRSMLEAQAGALGIDIAQQVEPEAAARQYRYDTREAAQLKYLLNFQMAHEAREALIASCFSETFGDDEASISTRLYLSVDQLRQLGGLGFVGTHGHDHQPPGSSRPTAIRDSLQTSLELLTGWSGFRPFAMSYPYGSFAACTVEASAAAAELGIEFAFTMERAGNADLDRPLHLARFSCSDLPGGNHAWSSVDSLFDCMLQAQWHR